MEKQRHASSLGPPIALVVPGQCFRFIACCRGRAGQRRNLSTIVFRRRNISRHRLVTPHAYADAARAQPGSTAASGPGDASMSSAVSFLLGAVAPLSLVGWLLYH